MLKAKKKNLTKKEISHQINIKIGLPKSYTEKILDDFIEIMKFKLKKDNLNIKNFGLFKLINKTKRIGRNPKTKIEYEIDARKTISFLPSRKMSVKINKF